MSGYKAGDEISFILTEPDAEELNDGMAASVTTSEITSHKPKADLLDEATKLVHYDNPKVIELLVQYLREQRDAK